MDMQYNFNKSQEHNGLWDLYVNEVNLKSSGDVFSYKYLSEMNGNLIGSVDNLCAELRNCGIKLDVKFTYDYYVLRAKSASSMAVVSVGCDRMSDMGLSFNVVGERSLLDKIMMSITGGFPKISHGTLKWFRLEKGSLTYDDIVVKSKRKVHSEFYPWIKEGVEAYLSRFMASDASILLMLGPPGTGKTSLIRHLVSDRNLTAIFSYDEALLESDSFFSTFIVGNSNLMVIEDADTLIGSRENGNKLIPRFLNTAEGLVKIEGKKMIFTTNLESVRNIDAALVRPGRCFDVMKTRLLTHKEMLAVVDVCGLESTPPWKEEYSLSEIFSPAMHTSKAERRVGF